jgi:mRNA interferase MazF
MKRYDIRWADLDPVRGSEMAKTRPVVIVSRDELNAALATVTVCPLTTQIHPSWRTRLPVRIGARDAEVAVDQIRAVSKHRLGRATGRLSGAQARALRRMITDAYGE